MHKVSHPAYGSLVADADLIVVNGDPLKDLRWRPQGRHMPLIVKYGAFVTQTAINWRMT
jgi:imidazolonepropionase-like amidohydrolase